MLARRLVDAVLPGAHSSRILGMHDANDAACTSDLGALPWWLGRVVDLEARRGADSGYHLVAAVDIDGKRAIPCRWFRAEAGCVAVQL
jgi:hypothetical protein